MNKENKIVVKSKTILKIVIVSWTMAIYSFLDENRSFEMYGTATVIFCFALVLWC